MKTTIQIGELRKGDIIVTTSRGAGSWWIRQAIGADFSHAMLYVGNEKIIDAMPDRGVEKRHWTDASRDAGLAIALRRRNMTDALREEVGRIAEQFLQRKFDFTAAAVSGAAAPRGMAVSALVLAGILIHPVGRVASFLATTSSFPTSKAAESAHDKSFFCSELVARVYQLIGKSLYDGLEPNMTNPRQVRTSSKLMYVGHLIG